jgi:hypothetical protein
VRDGQARGERTKAADATASRSDACTPNRHSCKPRARGDGMLPDRSSGRFPQNTLWQA